ncbi:Aldo/keto reductase [Pholiota conissans]|uniref:Aldo/keto reductase n=1 Tax=Pholiota conissans TaxID=109636 RepID=A0A9P5ZBB5_9AGAR|nr:Aldo/keto reductase [Pholiota conissans]
MPFADIELNDGNKIPAIAFGSGSVNKGQDIHRYIEQAIETGFNHLDTAQFYQNQESLGKAIRESGLSRSELYITSKWGFGQIHDALNESLTKIGIKQLDLYLIHTPTAIENDEYEGAWRTFEKIKEDGFARSIGVSNFSVEDLQKIIKIAKVKPAVNQIRLHPYNISENAALLEYHKQHGVITEAYGSLAPITTFPGGPVDEPLEKAAHRLGISTTQVVFLWVKAKGAVIVTTSSNKQHLEEYFAVGDLPDLTQEEVAAIDAAGANGPPSRFLFIGTRRLPTSIWSRVTLVAFFFALIYYAAFAFAARGFKC